MMGPMLAAMMTVGQFAALSGGPPCVTRCDDALTEGAAAAALHNMGFRVATSRPAIPMTRDRAARLLMILRSGEDEDRREDARKPRSRSPRRPHHHRSGRPFGAVP